MSGPQSRSKRRSLRDASNLFHKLMGKNKTDHAATVNAWLSGLGAREEGFDPRLVPQLVDRIAERRPENVWTHVPKNNDISLGFRAIRWRELGDAVNRAAEWFEQQLHGRSTKDEVVAFLAPSKTVTPVLILATAKVSCSILFLSPRNSLEGQLSLIDKLGCTYLMTPESQLAQTRQIKQERRQLEHIIVPELEYFLSGPAPKRRPYHGRFEDLRQKPLLWLHSSGTTSLPKPVPWTHSVASGYLTEAITSYPEGETLAQTTMAGSKRFFNAFPMFHAAGISHALTVGPMGGIEIVMPPEGVPMNGSMANEIFMSKVAPFTVFMPPAILVEIYKDPKMYKNLLKQTLVATAGAGLSKDVGDAIQRDGLRIINILASSETGYLPLLAPKPASEWNAFHFPSKAPGLELQAVGKEGDDTHEIVLHKIRNGSRLPPVFDNFPQLNIYRTNDMMRPHPNPKLSHLWLVAGRADDVIVLSNGEKFTPVALEEAVAGHRDVITALVIGMQREQSALLIEPKDEQVCRTHETRAAFIDSLWPAIAKANSRIAQHGRVMKSHVMLTTPAKGVLRTPKGSVQRSKMYELYKPETDQLYAGDDDGDDSGRNNESNDSSSQRTVVSDDEGDHEEDVGGLENLKGKICDVAEVDPGRLGYDDNIFEAGFDSLHATQLVKLLRSRDHKPVETSLVYNNPSTRGLHAALSGSAKSGKKRGGSEGNSEGGFRATSIVHTLQELSKDLPAGRPTSSDKVVLMTGTSGGLGQHLLCQARSRYSHVYCLLRQPLPEDHQDIPGVTFLHADLAAPCLGLKQAQWSTLLYTVTHVVHNAWLVDFNHPLPHFTSNLVGVRGLINFAAAAHHNPRIWFASSISAVAGMRPSPKVAVVERLYPLDPSGPDGAGLGMMGYAQSKRAAELLLARAGEISGVRSTVVRIGQIAGASAPGLKNQEGSVLPSWQVRDFIPTLLRSARHLKSVPRTIEGTDPYLSWTPIDHVAASALDLLEDGDREGADTTQVFHLANPAADGDSGAPSWEDMLPTIRHSLASTMPDTKNEDIEVVSFADWVDRLEKSAKAGKSRQEIEKENPGIKLLEYFKAAASNRGPQIPRLDTEKACEASVTLRAEKPMNSGWMAQWIHEWFAEA